jgi:hypothetical protein
MDRNLFNNKRVALVGPSPHILGKNLGKFIDSFDTVVRVNEIGVINNLYKDYGSRTDVAFLSLSEQAVPFYKEMIKNVKHDQLKVIVHPRDKNNYNPVNNQKTESVRFYFDLLDLDKDYYQIDNPTIFETTKLFGCFPSTGSLTILELLNYDFKELYICGFSFYLTKYRYQPKRMEWWRIPKQNQHKHNYRQGGHNTRQEVKVLKKILKKHSNIYGDKLFQRVILSESMIYYEIRRFIVYKLNLDNYKNIIKKLFRKKTYIKILNKYK